MRETQTAKPKVRIRRQGVVATVVAVLILVAVVAIITHLMTPQRSVAAYCKVYKAEKLRLAKFPGDTYPAGIFNDSLSDAGEFATSFGRLEAVAPTEIEPDVKTLKLIYQKIHDDPAQAISASLSGAPADDSLKAWTSRSCSLGL